MGENYSIYNHFTRRRTRCVPSGTRFKRIQAVRTILFEQIPPNNGDEKQHLKTTPQRMHQTADRRMFAQLKVKLAQGIPSMVYTYKTKKEVSTILSGNTTCAIHTCEIQPWERETTKSLYPILLISEKVTRWTHQNNHTFYRKGNRKIHKNGKTPIGG